MQDQSGETAIWIWSEVGNLLRLVRGRVSDPNAPVAIVSFSPAQGAPGTPVTIWGKGFGSIPAQNQVTFAGTPALVTAASPVQLITVVPEGATTGPIAVTTVEGRATSAQPFTVVGPTITTVAGTGTAGYSGDDGPATLAQLNQPNGVALDGAGTLFIADRANHRIRVVNLGGTIATIAGTGTGGYSGDGGRAPDAQLNTPTGVARANTGSLFIADRGNHRIRRVDATTGIITTVAGTGVPDFGGDGGPATSAQLNLPFGITFDLAGNLYIADQFNHRIRKVDPGGVITTVAGDGTPAFGGDGGPATSAQLNFPLGVALDGSGNLLIADTDNNRIRRVAAASGTITSVAGDGTPAYGGDGGPATSAQLNAPFGVAVDPSGALYIADRSNHRIRKVTGP